MVSCSLTQAELTTYYVGAHGLMVKGRSAIRAGGSLSVMLLVCLWQVGIAYAQSAFDLDGRSVNPLSAVPGKVVVLVFLRRDCPISNRYAPVIQKISAQFAQDASFWLVYPDKDESSRAVRKYLQDYGYHLPALRDPNHALVKLAQVQVTPEVAVFDRNRELIYDGRIDNWYQDFGRVRPAPTTHELEEAIRSALAGKRVATREIRGTGCYISDLE
jgi:thiol-disulfide isomerase/thioredoxin